MLKEVKCEYVKKHSRHIKIAQKTLKYRRCALDKINSRQVITEEEVGDLKDMTIETIQNKAQEEE